MTKTMIAKEWEEFYLITLAWDIDGDIFHDMNDVQSYVKYHIDHYLGMYKKEAEIFGQLMSQIPGIEEPSGTEDRVPVRTFFVLFNENQELYKNYISFHNGDFYAITHYMHLFAEHSTVSLRK